MKSLIRVMAAAAAVASLGVRADDFDDIFSSGGEAGEEAGEEIGEDAGEDAGEAVETSEEGELPVQNAERIFYSLPHCSEVEGLVEVLVPGKAEWIKAEEGRRYPLGSSYRTTGPDARLKVKFGPDAVVSMNGAAAFSTRAQIIGEKTRTIALLGGTVTVKLADQMPAGSFTVSAPGFAAVNPAGESRYVYSRTADGDEATVRCVTKTLSIEGLHFKIPAMRAANEIRIRTSQDQLVTAIYGMRGDVMVKLDQGKVLNKDFGTGATTVESKSLDWKLSPLTTVRIHRAKPALGKNMAVTVMTFNSSGELKNRCAFAENTPEINSGELGPTSKKEREELAKRAAEAAAAVDAEATDADAEEEEADDDSSSGDSDDDVDDLF